MGISELTERTWLKASYRSACRGDPLQSLTKDRQTALKQCYTTDHMYRPG